VTTCLACTWHIRGEIPRFRRLLEQFRSVYSGIVLSLAPGTAPRDLSVLEAMAGVSLVVTEDWSHGRHVAIHEALEQPWSHVHYANMDRLLHWVETEPEEWLCTVDAIQHTDCLIIGRTEKPPAGYATDGGGHQRSRLTSPGAVRGRGFGRRAAEFLMAGVLPLVQMTGG